METRARKTRRRFPRKDIKREDVHALYFEQGLGLNETADELGVGVQLLRNRMRSWGMKPRPRGGFRNCRAGKIPGQKKFEMSEKKMKELFPGPPCQCLKDMPPKKQAAMHRLYDVPGH